MIICNTEIRPRAPLTYTGDFAFFPRQSQALKAGSHLILGGKVLLGLSFFGREGELKIFLYAKPT